jgi:hypothetical protein
MNSQILDALVQTVNEAIDKKISGLRESLQKDLPQTQSQIYIELIKSTVQIESAQAKAALQSLVEEQIKNIHVPQDGKDGEDAPAPTAEQIAEAVTAWMVANFTQPTNGKDGTDGKDGIDGKDGNSVSIDEVKSMAEGWLSQNIKQPKDGEHGKDGRDSAEIEVLPSIDEEKSYPKGTWASYKGGLIKSTRTTSAIGEKSLMEAGWDVIVQGVQSVEVHPLAEGEFAVKTILTGGKDHITKFAVPVMVYKGIWKEGAYTKGNTVTTGGSLWHCNKDTTDKPGTSEAWQLCAKKGTDGRDGKDLNVVKMNKPEFYKLDK